MGYTFDGPNKKITLTAGTTEVDIGDMYSRWYDWLVSSDNAKFLLAFRNVGGDAVSDVRNLGITYFLTNGWRVVPQSASHRLILSGNLYTDPFGFSPVDGVPGYSIVVEYSVSNLIDIVTADPGSLATALYDDEEVETGMSIREFYRGAAAAMMGKVSGVAALAPVFRAALSDHKARISATADASGNRLTVVLDLS